LFTFLTFNCDVKKYYLAENIVQPVDVRKKKISAANQIYI